MHPEHANAAAYRVTADAFRARDFATLERLIADDVVWHVPGRHRWAGEIRGRDVLLAWLGSLHAIGFWLREHDVLANDQHVCALSVMGARRPGIEVETRVVSVFHFLDGRQTERWIFPEDADAWERIFGVGEPPG